MVYSFSVKIEFKIDYCKILLLFYIISTYSVNYRSVLITLYCLKLFEKTPILKILILIVGIKVVTERILIFIHVMFLLQMSYPIY